MPESKRRASMNSSERLPWVPRVLRPYESHASALAKLAYLSLTPGLKFLDEAHRKIGVPVTDPYGPYVFDISQDRFLEVTGEEPRRLWLQTFRNLQMPSRILRLTDMNVLDFSRLRICEQCLAAGFHSSLHQLSWLGRCFAHGDTLIQLRRFTGQHPWRDIAKLLFDTWFKGNGPWPVAMTPFRWGPVDRAPYLRVVPELMRVLRRTERWARTASVHMLQWHEGESDDVTRLQLLVKASLEGQLQPSPRVVKLLQLDEPGFCKVVVNARVAKATGSMTVPELEGLAMNRFEASLAVTPAPAWLVQFRKFIKNATSGHEECFSLLASSIIRWHSIWPVRQDPGRSEAVLLQLLGFGVETCSAVRLVELLSLFRTGPMFKASSHRVPWFRLTNLRAAVGPWLSRSRAVAATPKGSDDLQLRPLLDLLISVWIGQTLTAALKPITRDLKNDVFNATSLAYAGTGQAKQPQFLRRPMLGDCLGQVVLTEEGGQVFALYRDPLPERLPEAADDCHREQLFEAVTLAEAANQRQWPPGRFMRCSMPSAQMTARVSSILQRWTTDTGA